jgi:hypothetical protein
MAVNDELIQALRDEREAVQARLAAIELALDALTGTQPALHTRRKQHVGDDKLDAVRAVLEQTEGWVRQASIVDDTGLNPGSVSTALAVLLDRGEVERGPKRDRSVTWKLVEAA